MDSRNGENSLKKTLVDEKNRKEKTFGFILYRYIMFGRGICEKYQSRDDKFSQPNGEGNLV
jgi:hypothetical protein